MQSFCLLGLAGQDPGLPPPARCADGIRDGREKREATALTPVSAAVVPTDGPESRLGAPEGFTVGAGSGTSRAAAACTLLVMRHGTLCCSIGRSGTGGAPVWSISRHLETRGGQKRADGSESSAPTEGGSRRRSDQDACPESLRPSQFLGELRPYSLLSQGELRPDSRLA